MRSHNARAAERSITLNATVIRWGNDGVGLKFVLHNGKGRRQAQADGVQMARTKCKSINLFSDSGVPQANLSAIWKASRCETSLRVHALVLTPGHEQELLAED